jgi:hypothetical protein
MELVSLNLLGDLKSEENNNILIFSGPQYVPSALGRQMSVIAMLRQLHQLELETKGAYLRVPNGGIGNISKSTTL